MSETSQIVELLNEVSTRLEGLEARIAELRAVAEGEWGAVDARRERLVERLTALPERVAALRGEHGRLVAALDATREKRVRIEAAIESITSALRDTMVVSIGEADAARPGLLATAGDLIGVALEGALFALVADREAAVRRVAAASDALSVALDRDLAAVADAAERLEGQVSDLVRTFEQASAAMATTVDRSATGVEVAADILASTTRLFGRIA